MAISATAVGEVRTTGNDANGGFFNASGASAGSDYSQQDSSQLSLSDVVTNGTTTATSATGGFTTAMIRNGINIAGTCYEITARTDTNTITLDRTAGAASGQAGNVGGAWATLGKACAVLTTTGNDFYFKSGTYTLAASITSPAGSEPDNAGRMIGYNATRGDITAPNASGMPVIQAGANSITMINIGKFGHLENCIVDGMVGTYTSVRGVNDGGLGYGKCIRVTVQNCSNNGLSMTGTGALAHWCEVTGVTSGNPLQINVASIATYCYVHDNSSSSNACVSNQAGGVFVSVISANNTGSGFGGNSSGDFTAVDCLAVSNAGKGFQMQAFTHRASALINCVAAFNTGAGFFSDAVSDACRALKCAGFSTDMDSTKMVAEGYITLTADPFTAKASKDWSLNNTAGGGALLRALGIGGWQGLTTTTGYNDVGPVQHQDSGGGASGGLIVAQGFRGGYGG